jgi:hypothetical protein
MREEASRLCITWLIKKVSRLCFAAPACCGGKGSRMCQKLEVVYNAGMRNVFMLVDLECNCK